MEEKVFTEEELALAESLIPRGCYCYTPLGVDESNGRFFVKPCVFWDFNKEEAKKAGSEQAGGYCHYLKLGDWMENGTMLLWDQVKECGLNYGTDEDDVEFGENI